MEYEELRKKYQSCQKSAARMGDLQGRADNGGLSPERLVACRQEIARLTEELGAYEHLFALLEDAGDPAWLKLSRELDAALNEYQEPANLRKMAKDFIGTISILILGTWIVDGLRKKQ